MLFNAKSEFPAGYCTYDQVGIPPDEKAASLCSSASIFARNKGVDVHYLREVMGAKTDGRPLYRQLVVLPRWAFEKAIERRKEKESRKKCCPTCGRAL